MQKCLLHFIYADVYDKINIPGAVIYLWNAWNDTIFILSQLKAFGNCLSCKGLVYYSELDLSLGDYICFLYVVS